MHINAINGPMVWWCDPLFLWSRFGSWGLAVRTGTISPCSWIYPERERERYFDIPWYTQTSISSTYPNIYKKSLLIYIIYVLSIYSEHVTSIPWIQELAIAVPQRVASLALLATYSSALYALPTTAALVDLARSMGLLTRDLREQGLEDGGFLGIEHDGKLGV